MDESESKAGFMLEVNFRGYFSSNSTLTRIGVFRTRDDAVRKAFELGGKLSGFVITETPVWGF